LTAAAAAQDQKQVESIRPAFPMRAKVAADA
jgi:hypothetical protein